MDCGMLLNFTLLILLLGEMPAPGGKPPRVSASSPIIYDPADDRVYVANADSSTLTILDADRLSVLAEIPVGRDPRSVCLGPGEEEAFVPGRRDGTLTAVSTAPPHSMRSKRVGVEPRGLLWSPESESIVVSDRSAGEILWVSPDSLAVTRRLSVGHQPVPLARAGSRLLVGHLHGGAVSEVDAVQGRMLREISLRPDAGLVRSFAVDIRGQRLYIPHTRFATEAEDLLFDTMIFPAVAEIDLQAGSLSRTISIDAVDRPENDPFAAALAPDGRLLVVHGGSETLSAIDVRPPRGAAAGRVSVGRNPRGVAVDGKRRRAYILNFLSDDVSTVDLARMEEIRRVRITRSPLPERFLNGKRLFHDGRSGRATLDRWMSCASCHPDGETCRRTWRYPAGRRDVHALFGATRTRPLFWKGTRDEIQDFEWAFRRFQGGRGVLRGLPHPDLGPPNLGRSGDLDDLTLYIGSLEPAPSAFRYPDGSYSGGSLRGRVIFFSEETGCLSCHPPPFYTDSGFRDGRARLHDVGTGDAPDEKLGPAFDAPALVDLEHSAPYLHDGRATTLLEVLTRWNRGDRHGRTSHLGEQELSDLAAFLLAIPLVRTDQLLPGDSNLDGQVDRDDLNRVRALLEEETLLKEEALLKEETLLNIDLNRNGTLDESDLERIAGMVKEAN